MDIKISNLTSLESTMWNNIVEKTTIIQGYSGLGKTASLVEMVDKITINESKLEAFIVKLPQLYRDLDSLYSIYDCVSEKPTLIIFEGLTSCDLFTFNIVQSILLTRTIDNKILPDTVFMVATADNFNNQNSNLYNIDNTINIFDFSFSLDYWIKVFAQNNIQPVIIEFLKENNDLFIDHSQNKEIDSVINTPRNWSFISKMIDSFITEQKASAKEIDEILSDFGVKFLSKNTLERFHLFAEKYPS